MEDYNLLLIGTIIPDKYNISFLEYGINPAPAEIVQKYLIEGFSNCSLASVTVVSSPRIPAYPRVSLKKVEDIDWKCYGATIHTVGFNNNVITGFIDRKKNIVSKACEWADKYSSKKKVLLLYSMHSPFLEAAKEIKKKYPDTEVGMIVPDLPIYMATYKGIKRVLKAADIKKINKLLPYVDKYILYTKHMATYLGLKDNEWIVLEGLIDVKKIKTNNTKNDKKPSICLYAGRLDKRYAIDKLIKAFEYIPDAELHLYGNKNDAKEFNELLSSNKNTKYMGALTQEQIFIKMQEADLLINPRPSNLDLAKYSCPSKTFEYMASGTPVLMTKLPGLPEEYYPYLYFFKNESVEGFAESIHQILNQGNDVLFKKGLLAQQFLIQNKDANKQVARIVDFIIGRNASIIKS